MPSPFPSFSLLPDELGVNDSARLIGVPVVTLRLHCDQGKVQGVRKDAKGYRFISKEGLFAYARARGLETPEGGRFENRKDYRLPDAQSRIRLVFRDGKRVLGEGEGLLADLSQGGLRVVEARWTGGALPSPSGELHFELLSGVLKGTRGLAQVAWMTCKDHTLSFGLKRLTKEASRQEPWDTHVKAEADKKREADLAYAQRLNNPWARKMAAKTDSN